MTVQELINKLQKQKPDDVVVIDDGISYHDIAEVFRSEKADAVVIS